MDGSSIPTLPLATEQLILTGQLAFLPPELKFRLLEDIDDEQLINICLANQQMLEICWDPFLAFNRKWDSQRELLFKLKLVFNCQHYSECQILMVELESLLRNNPFFINNYRTIITNSDLASKVNEATPIIKVLFETPEITFNPTFNLSIDLKYFLGLRKVTFGNNFNQKVNGLLPNLIEIVFGNNFNQSVNNLPLTLESITFGRKFNSPVNNLPNNTKYLKFGFNFNQIVDSLPDKLERLIFIGKFNKSVSQLPVGLKYLALSDNFNRSTDLLPKGLLEIIFGKSFNQKVNNLPSTVEYLKFGDYFNQSIDQLPIKLKVVIFGNEFNRPVDHLPPGLDKIIFGIWFNKSINQLPNSVTHITFPFSMYSKPINKFPANLKYFKIGKNYHYYTQLLMLAQNM